MKIAAVMPANGKGYSLTYPKAISKLEQLGFEITTKFVSIDPSNPFHSDSDAARTANLIDALNSDAEVIWCIAGGYGSAKIIPELAKLPLPEKEKIFIGFSDITALHLFFSQVWGWNTIHGSMIASYASDKFNPQNIEKILDVVRGKKPETTKIDLLNKASESEISGKLTGGNLAVIQTSIGTTHEIDAKNKILILEDVNEAGYKVDRILLHLKQAKIFDDVAAVIFGDFNFTDSNSAEELLNIEYALKSFADSVDFPVFKTTGIGHDFNNQPFIYNYNALVTIENGEWHLTHV